MTPEQTERINEICDKLRKGEISVPEGSKQLEELYLEAAVFGDISVKEAARLLERTERSVHNYVVQRWKRPEEREEGGQSGDYLCRRREGVRPFS